MLRRRLIDVAFVLALVVSALAVFAYLHSGGHGTRVCEALGSGGPGTLSVAPPGARCWVSDEGSEPGVFISGIFPFALAAAWAVIAAPYLAVLRRRRASRPVEAWAEPA